MDTTRKRGRPPKNAEEVRDLRLETRVSAAELAALEAAAGERPVSTWAREVLLRAARRLTR